MAGSAISPHVFAVAASVIVGATVLASLLLIDTPWDRRAMRIDDKRENDLIELARLVDCHWTMEGQLPASLGAAALHLRDPARRDDWPRACGFVDVNLDDPAQGDAYGYTPGEANVFELCATFALEGVLDQDFARGFVAGTGRDLDIFRQHGAGRRCFTLTAVDRRTPE